MSYDSYILDLQTTHVFLFNFLLQCPSKKMGCCRSCQRRAWSIDSNHASQPTLRLDNFLLSRTLEIWLSQDRFLWRFMRWKNKTARFRGVVMCKAVDSCGAQFSTYAQHQRGSPLWGLSEMASSEQTIAVALQVHWVPRLGVAGFSLVHTGVRADTSSIGRRLQGVMTSKSWPNWGGVSKFDPFHIIIWAIQNTPIPSHYTSWLIGFPTMGYHNPQ